MKKLAIWNIVLLFSLFGMSVIWHDRVDKKDLAFSVCEESRIYDTVSEDTCGDLLTRFNLDYVCGNPNNFKTNKCVVEEI